MLIHQPNQPMQRTEPIKSLAVTKVLGGYLDNWLQMRSLQQQQLFGHKQTLTS